MVALGKVANNNDLEEALINAVHQPSAVRLIFKGLQKYKDFRESLAEH